MAARSFAGSGAATGRSTQISVSGAAGRRKRNASRCNSGGAKTRATPGAGANPTSVSGATAAKTGNAGAKSPGRIRSTPALGSVATAAKTGNAGPKSPARIRSEPALTARQPANANAVSGIIGSIG